MTKWLMVVCAAVVMTPSLAADLQYSPKDPNEAVQEQILNTSIENSRACMHGFQKQMLAQGMRNTEQIVDKSVTACGQIVVRILASTPNVPAQAAIAFARSMAYDELRKISGVVLPNSADLPR